MVLGLLLGLVGTDVNSGIRRFAFGMTGLADGIEFVALSMAIYGIAEVAYNLEKKQETSVVTGRDRQGAGRACADLRDCTPARSCAAPCSARCSACCRAAARCSPRSRAYTLEKKVAKPPRKFGEGDIRGVAAPESANNAGAQTSFIPMLTLGIPVATRPWR